MSHRIHSALTAVLLLVVCCEAAVAQRSFNHSRTGNPLGGRTTGTYSINTGGGSRWGTPPTSGFGASSRPSSSPKWDLRPTYNTSRSVSPRYDAGFVSRGPSLSYSSAPRSSHAYSVYPGLIQYQHGHHHSHLHPYDQARFINGLSLQYSYLQNFVAPPAIIAPPIVIPYGGFGSPFFSTGPELAPPPSTIQMPVPFSAPQQMPLPVPAAENSQTLSPGLPADETPIVDEFGGAVVNTRVSVAAADRIRSLRYQTSGDNAFRKQDYASAAVFYKSAAETAPSRRGPWLRLTWAQIAQQQFEDAVISLKTALDVNDDLANSWIAGPDLYGNQFAVDGDRHGDDVWEWLQQRPNSSDRLMLVAGFQQMRGYSGIARELLEAAAATGLHPVTVTALREVASDQLRQQMERPAPVPATTTPTIGDKDFGIQMRGRELLSPSSVLPSIGQPEELPRDAALPAETELPQEAKNIPLVPEVSGVSPMSLQIPVNK